MPLEKAKRIGLYLLIAALPVALWLLRNVLVHGSYEGPRNPSPYTLLEVLDKFLSDLGGWVFLYLPSGNVRVAAAALVGVALLVLAVSVGHAFIRSCRKAGNGAGWSPFYLFGGFALVYLVFLAAVQARIELQPLGDRYLSPVYIPLLFAAVFALDKLLGLEPGRKALRTFRRAAGDSEHKADGSRTASLLVVTLVTTLSLWLAGQVALNAYEIRRNNEGRGMGMAARWVNSETLRYVEEHLMAERIFSNATSAIYLRTDHADYHYLPPEPTMRRMRGDIENAVPGDYVAWMDPKKHPRHIAVLRKLLGLGPVAELSDGSIYRVTRSGADPAPAFFISAVAPMAGEPFVVKLSAWLECRRSRYQPWQWERGSDAAGWTKVTSRGATYRYTPITADVGHRLRAYVYCTDTDGKTIRAMTAPSAPVLQAADRADALRSAD